MEAQKTYNNVMLKNTKGDATSCTITTDKHFAKPLC